MNVWFFWFNVAAAASAGVFMLLTGDLVYVWTLNLVVAAIALNELQEEGR